MIWTNILQVKKYGVVQMVSPISRDFLFLAIKLNCCDRFSSKTDISKIAFVSQNVQSFKKKSPKAMQENPLLTLLFLAMLTSYNIRKNLRFYMSARRLLKLASSARARS